MEQEKYVFTYTKEEVKEANDAVCLPTIKRIGVLLGIMGLFLAISVATQQQAAIIGMFAGIFAMYFIVFINYFRQKKLRLAAAMKIVEKQYEVTVTPEKVIMQIKIGEEEGTRHVFPLAEIKPAGETANICILQCNGIAFLLRKDMLVENSLLKPFLQGKKAEDSFFSWILFWCSLFTMPIAIGIAGHLSSVTGTEYPQNMWVFFLFVPVAIASLIYGIVKHKKKNIIVGSIMTVLLIVWGCFCFIPFPGLGG